MARYRLSSPTNQPTSQPTNQPTNQPALEPTAGKHQKPIADSPESEAEYICSTRNSSQAELYATFGTTPTVLGQLVGLVPPSWSVPGTRLRRLPDPIGGRLRQEQKSFLLATRRTSCRTVIKPTVGNMPSSSRKLLPCSSRIKSHQVARRAMTSFRSVDPAPVHDMIPSAAGAPVSAVDCVSED